MNFFKKQSLLLNSNSVKVFVNSLIKNGLKNKSIKIFKNILLDLKKKNSSNYFSLLHSGFDNLRILVHIYKRKVGSKIIIIPSYWKLSKKLRKGFLLLKKNSLKRNERSFNNKIINEFFDVINNKGKTINARNELYTLAENNQYNLRYVMNFNFDKSDNFDNKFIMFKNLDYYSDISKNDLNSFFDYYEKENSLMKEIQKNKNIKIYENFKDRFKK